LAVKVKTHKDLEIWQNGIELVVQIYEITSKFPKTEIYGLTSQLRRSAVSVPSNIAEGAARNSDKEFIQFLYISLGSLSELETQLIIAEKIGYGNAVFLNDLIEKIRRMTLNLIKFLKTRISK